MTSTENLLVELLVEELPPKALRKLGDAFAEGIAASLTGQGLLADDTAITRFATPRRLGVHLTGVASKAADKPVSQKLMPVSVGLKDGAATPALLKKLGTLGLDATAVPQLKREGEGKNEALFLDSVQAGATLQEGLQKALEDTLRQLPIPKVMTYQLETGVALPGWDSVQFVRPAHGLVALHGSTVVPVTVLGLHSGNTTHGHRFEGTRAPIAIGHADTYAQQLREAGAVIASYDERRDTITAQLQAAAQQVGDGARPIDDEALLDEVTSLVELPNVLIGQFEPEFLEVPQECLILTMKANQKYFPLLDASGTLTNRFLLVSNIRPEDASAVTGGNERVVRPRLADAKFFFDQDRKKTLASRLPQLGKVVYHNQLGTQGERVERVRAIARGIAEKLGIDAQQVDQAAQLAKTDLVTDMVGEFPELQGTMGRYYALSDGLPPAVADAIEDHYKPRFAGDALPRSDVGVAVALADKLETLVGLFGIGQVPTGDKDPFALRRHALGVIRMLVEKDLPIELHRLLSDVFEVFDEAFGGHGIKEDLDLKDKYGSVVAKKKAVKFLSLNPLTPELVESFIFDRLAGTLREQGYSAQEIDAVLALQPQRLADVAQRLQAVRAFAQLPEAEALAAANKRVGNILKKADGEVLTKVDTGLLQEAAEQALYAALQDAAPQAQQAYEAGDYTASLQALAVLKAPVDAFFDQVMVNADDAALKANRLGLLRQLQDAMNRVADLSRLAS